MAWYLEDPRMRTQLVGASQLWVVPTWIENHWCHINLSVHVLAKWMLWHMRGVDLRNMPQPRESIVLIEIWVVGLGGTCYYVDNMSWWRVTRIIGGCGHWIAIQLVSGVIVHASASSWKVLESRFISWRYMSKIQECERNQLALQSCELCQHGLKITDATLVWVYMYLPIGCVGICVGWI